MFLGFLQCKGKFVCGQNSVAELLMIASPVLSSFCFLPALVDYWVNWAFEFHGHKGRPKSAIDCG